MKNFAIQTLVLVFVSITALSPKLTFAQGDPNEKYRIYESNTDLFSVSWDNEGTGLVFQERFYDNAANRQIDGVDTEGTDTWNQYSVNTQQSIKGDYWPLQPNLTPTQYTNYEISVGDYTAFVMASPNSRFIAYPAEIREQPYLPLGIADLQTNQHAIFEEAGIDTITSLREGRVYWSVDSSAFIYLRRTQGGDVRVYHVSGLENLANVQILRLDETLLTELSFYIEEVFGIDAGGDRVLLYGFPENSSALIIWNVNTGQFVDIPMIGPVAGAAFWGEDHEYVMFVDEEGLKRFDIQNNRVTIINPNITSTWARGGAYFSPDMHWVAIHNGGEPVRDALYIIPISDNRGLALFRTGTRQAYLLQTLATDPAAIDYYTYATGVPIGSENSQWVVGDWDGDGVETPGAYATNGVFYHTNVLGPSSTWEGTWFGLNNIYTHPVAGRFNAAINHDCIGITDGGDIPPYGIAFALYFTCDLSGGNPPKTFQWLSVLLPDSQGHSGVWEFGAGNFDPTVDAVDTIACRRGNYITWTNTPPTTQTSVFPYAQYIGAPHSGTSLFVVGDWNNDATDSFGLYYVTLGRLRGRNDLDWNSGLYPIDQQLDTNVLGTTSISATTWGLR